METKTFLITGGAGFIGSTVAAHLLKKGHGVVIFDSFIRQGVEFNTKRLEGAQIVRGDVRFDYDFNKVGKVDGVYHAAANPGIKWSIDYPMFDFDTNARGTVNVLEFARKKGGLPVVYCSTNKVYDGTKINQIPLEEKKTRYVYKDPNFKGISSDFPVDGPDHSCYGVSKLAGDLYCQEYSHNMGVPTVVNRMSCIGGTWQLGVEDQGWLSWFVLAAVSGKQLNIYGDGKQVRDVLDGENLAKLVEIEFKKIDKIKGSVFNVGGGMENTLSLLECIAYLEEKLNIKIPLKFHDWRVADQKVYISDISKVSKIWKPETDPKDLLMKVHKWTQKNPQIIDFYKKRI